jgi:GPH family glycoside/pentoside/hexuronide:cation symporter
MTREAGDDRAPPVRTMKPLAPRVKAAYALGGVVDIFGHWFYLGLLHPVFVGFLHLSPALLGIALAVSRLVDAFSDPFFGWRSDNTRTRWGRRRPFILVGAILSGVALPFLFLASPGWSPTTLFWFVLLSSCAFAPLLGAYAMPYQSLGAELTADSDERTSIMAWRGATQTLAGVVNAWAWWMAARPCFAGDDSPPNLARGAVWIAALIGGVMVLAGIACARFVPEPYYAMVRGQARASLRASLAQTLRNRPFRVLLAVLALFAVPASMVGALGFYVQFYYVLPGQPATAALYGGLAGTAYSILGALAAPLASWSARRWGKRQALQAALLGGAVVLGATYWLYTPRAPFLFVVGHGLFGVAASGFFWVLLPSMLADIVDEDELATGGRREGAFSAVLSYCLKLGTTVTLLLSGPLVEWLGFDATQALQAPATLHRLRLLFALLPATAALLAALALFGYPLSRTRMATIRERLEDRRGSV